MVLLYNKYIFISKLFNRKIHLNSKLLNKKQTIRTLCQINIWTFPTNLYFFVKWSNWKYKQWIWPLCIIVPWRNMSYYFVDFMPLKIVFPVSVTRKWVCDNREQKCRVFFNSFWSIYKKCLLFSRIKTI